jgi:photosystem II stability/assembly factor-like uncharacterized protein
VVRITLFLLFVLPIITLFGCASAVTGLPNAYQARWVSSNEGAAGCCSRETDIAIAPDGHIVLSSASSGVYLSSNNGLEWSRITIAKNAIERFVGVTARGIYVISVRDDGVPMSVVATDPHGGWKRAAGVGELRDLADDGQALYAHDETALVRSNDGGATWSVVRKPSVYGTLRLHSLVAPETGVLLAMAGDSAVVRSDDGGEHWRPLTPSPVYDRDDAPRLWRSSSGVLFVSGENGVFRSSDGGQGWRRSLPFAATYVADGRAGEIVAASADSGLYRSIDGGEQWSRLHETRLHRVAVGRDGAYHGYSLSEGFVRSIDMTRWTRTLQGLDDCALDQIYRAGDGRMYAAFTMLVGAARRARDHRIALSTDDGMSWSVLADSLPNRVTSLVVTERGEIVAGLSNDRGDSGSVWISRDGGTTFRRSGAQLGAAVVALAADAAGTLYAAFRSNAANSGALMISREGGATWERSTVVAPFRSLVVTPRGAVLLSDYWQSDVSSDGLVGHVHRSTDAGRTWKLVLGDAAGTDDAVRGNGSDLHVDDRGRVYTCGRNVVQWSDDDGITWSRSKAFPDDRRSSMGLFRVVTNGAGDVFAMTGFEVLRSTDRGATWSGSVGELTACCGLTDIATSARGTLFAGTTLRGLYRFLPSR